MHFCLSARSRPRRELRSPRPSGRINPNPSLAMPSLRTRQNGRVRCPGHDYRSKCIYHIVLNKAPGIPDFSAVIGIPGNHDWKPRTQLSTVGDAVAAAISSLKAEFPFTSVLRRCIMPDHIHIAFYVREASDTHLGTMMKALKSNARAKLNMEQTLFEEGYYDKILMKPGQLERMKAYISDNPRRHLIRIQNPGFFRRFRITDGEVCYEAYGNWDLLSEELIEPVKVSRSYSPEELTEKKRLWLRTIQNDGVIASPFIHPDEKKVRDWAATNGGAIIQLAAAAFPKIYKPSGAYYDVCAEGRLLMVSVPERQNHEKPSREHCLLMNAIAEGIAEGRFAPVL